MRERAAQEVKPEMGRVGAEDPSTAFRSGPPALRLDASARRNLGAAGLAWFLLIAIALTGWFVVVVPLRADILDNDLTLIFIGARIGLEHGWSQIYSLPLQHDLFAQLRPHAVFNDGQRFISPPPYAWLVAPLTLFGPVGATFVWLALSLIALGAAWWIAAPGELPARWLWVVGAPAWESVLYGLSLAQADLVILLAVAAAWRFAEAEKPYLAGIALGLSVIKPQLTLLLPVVLLVAGRWRIAAAWAATAAVLVAVSLALVGTQGLQAYIALLNDAQHVTNNRYFTLAYLFGSGWLTLVLQVLLAAATLANAHVNRHASNRRIFSLALVAAMPFAAHWHLKDFTILVLAAWLSWRERPPAWQRAWLLVIAIAGEFAWPLTPLPLLVAVAVWYLTLSRRQQPQTPKD